MLNYHEKFQQEIRKARDGQGKYREELLEQCRFCPFTMIADERLLIASHIKPWAASNDKEKVDPFNGYILSPLYDKLFDRGFITFTENRHVILSEFISPFTWKQINLKNDTFIKALPMDDKRVAYLKFHHESVFKCLYISKTIILRNKCAACCCYIIQFFCHALRYRCSFRAVFKGTLVKHSQNLLSDWKLLKHIF